MKLNDVRGRSVQLDPIAYESTDRSRAPDWVVVEGTADGAEGRWRFRGAVLLPVDCAELSDWLDDAATGSVGVTRVDEDPSLTFAEPSLAFGVASYYSQSTRIRVHLTHGFGPPWLDPDELSNTYSYFVELSLAPDDLRTASAVWRRQSSAFPERR
jgi:hypothetical protein